MQNADQTTETTAAQERSDAVTGEPPAWDAFISYAHNDLAVAMWVHGILERHRIRGHGPRRIFLDREELTTSGRLPDRLCSALDRSRHLVVLASRNSTDSPWVGKELRYFVVRHGWERVHVCRVGAPGDDAIPADYVARYPDEASRPHVPDLRGGWWRRGRRVRRAMPILASVAGLDSPAQLLRALRNHRRAWITLLAVVAVVALSWNAARVGWRETVWHAHEDSMRALVRDADRQRLDDSAVFAALRLLVALDRRSAAERVVAFLPDGVLRTLAQAQLAADRAHPACNEAQRLIASVDAVYLRRYALAPAIIGVRCAEPRLLAGSSAEADRDELVTRARRLVRAGAVSQARDLARSVPEPARVYVELAIAIESGDAEPLSRIAPPSACSDDHDEVIALSRLVGDLDAAGMLSRGEGLVVYAAQCLARVDIRGGSDWIEFARMAAVLAAIDQPDAARKYLEHVDAEHQRRPRTDPSHAVGWALRGLALERLGDAFAATSSFRLSLVQVFAPVEASRSWDEIPELTDILVTADRWRDAFTVVAQTPDVRARTLGRIRLLDRWLRKRQHRADWARWAETLDGLLLLE